MNLFDLFAKLTLDTSDYESKLKDAEGGAHSFASALGSGLGTAAKLGVAAVGAVTAAAISAGTALVNATSKVASYGDNIDKMSQKMGLSAKAYQEWDAVMQHSGTSIESLQASMKTLANAVENGNEAFQRLGITQEQIASMNNEELFSATITALQNVEDETERTYLAGQLLGRGATELGALLNTSAEDTQAMKDRVHELGGVMSDEAVKAAAAYQDSLQDMQTAFSSLSRNMISEFLPSVTTVMDGLTEIFAGDSNKGLGMVEAGVDDFLGRLDAAIPRVMEIGGKIVTSIGKAIQKNFPKIVKTGAELVTKLATSIIKGLPQAVKTIATSIATSIKDLTPQLLTTVLDIIETLTDPANLGGLIDAGISIVTGLADSIIEALPVLIERLPEILENLVTAIVENAPKLLEAGVSLMMALVEGLIEAVPMLIEAIPAMIETLKNGFVQFWENIKETGRQLLERIKEGFMERFGDFSAAVSEFVSGVVEWFEGIPQWFAELPEKIAYDLGVVVGTLAQWGSDAYAWAQENVPQIVESISTFFQELPGKINGFLDEAKQRFFEFASNMIATAQEKIPQLISTITSFFEELPGRLLEIGHNIVTGLWDGIVGAWDWLVGNVSSLIGSFVQGIKNTLGIASPSKVFASIGENMALGLDKGFDGAFGKVYDNITDSVGSLAGGDYSTDYTVAATARQASDGANWDTVAQLLMEIRDKIGGDVVLDSGELVGYMDNALGAMSRRKARAYT